MLNSGVDPNTRGLEGNTALMTAAIKGRSEIVKLLIADGAEVNLKNSQGFTALMGAEQEQFAEIVMLLKDAGALSESDKQLARRIFKADFKPDVPIDFQILDPFTDKTPYWMGYTTLSTMRDKKGTRRALIRSTKIEPAQLFLIFGQKEQLLPLLEERLNRLVADPIANIGIEEELMLSDRSVLKYKIITLSPGLIGGKAITLLIGTAELNGRLLIIDGGGSPEGFKKKDFLKIITALNPADFINE